MNSTRLFVFVMALSVFCFSRFSAFGDEAVAAGPDPSNDSPFRAITEDLSLRGRIAAAWFISPIRELDRKKPEKHLLQDGRYVELRTERNGDERLILLTRGDGKTFNVGAQGSWIIHRAASGALLRARFYPRSDQHLFLQFRPAPDARTLMDLVLYGAYPLYGVRLNLAFDGLLTTSLSRLLKEPALDSLAPYFDIMPESYGDLRSLLDAIRGHLGGLRYADDGALNEEGQPVFIESGETRDEESAGLNCSGFVKWLVDGLIRARGGSYLPISALKQASEPRGNSFSEAFEDSHDPYFGLDWTRNLAKAAYNALRGADENADYNVKISPFASLRLSGGPALARPYVGYLPDTGYETAGLKALLYTLAATEPGYFYLASLSRDRDSSPALLRHFHVAALFPYFDADGRFLVACLESAAETSVDSFISRYPGHYVHLVRIPVEKRFLP